jgi:hypothetical protein
MLTYNSQNAANYVSETVQGTGSEASKEANKSVAKDNDASIGSRATAAKDAVGDKLDQSSHNTKADVHKGKPPSLPSSTLGVKIITPSQRSRLINQFTEAAKH